MKNKLEFNLNPELQKLEEMIATTEEFYGLISNRLPEIEQEIDDTIEETELLIDYFTDTSQTANAGSNSQQIEAAKEAQIAEVLNNLQKRIDQVYEALSAREDISQLLAGFVQDDSQEEAEFAQILQMVDQLNQVLRNLENLSINAVIFSVKKDKEGAAFRVISDEINSLSNQLKEKYGQVESELQGLQTWYDEFTAELEDLIAIEEKISTEYRGEIEKIFTEVLDSLQTVADILRDFMNHIQTAVEPIYDIIVLLQNQDIIRQNIENLSEIITSLQQEIDNLELGEQDVDQNLNMLSFITDVSHLGQKLMNNILNQLDDSLFKIQDKFDQMETSLQEVDEEGTQVFDFFAGQPSQEQSGKSSVDLIYSQLIDFVPQLIEELEVLGGKYEQIIKNQDRFYTQMDNLEEEFSEIDKVADQFQKLEVLAKIEFARMKSDDQSFVRNIEEAIEKFITASQENEDLYKKLREELAADYDQFIALSRRDKKQINDSRQIIEESEQKLLMTKQLIKEAIQGLYHSIAQLIDDILQVNQEIEEVYHLKARGEKFISKLTSLEEEAESIKQDYLEKRGIEEWEFNNSRLQELEDKFSSYLERKTANEEVTDFEVDAGSEGGELTMF